jgi:hypothetical protein
VFSASSIIIDPAWTAAFFNRSSVNCVYQVSSESGLPFSTSTFTSL